MARIAEFSPFRTQGTPGAGGLTLDALMDRQKLLARNATQLPQMQEMASPWQGAAYLANTIGDVVGQNRAASDVAATRDALAKARAGINYETGATDQQINEIAQFDPDLAENLMQQRLERAKEQRGYTHAERMQQAGFTHADVSREDTQAAAVAAQQAGFTHADTSREDAQQAAVDAATTSDQRKQDEEARKAEAGAKRIVSGDEAKQLGGDPSRQYTVSADGTTLTDITPAPRVGYRPATEEDLAKYPNLDPSKAYEVNTATDQVSPVGAAGSINIQLPPAEIAARIAMGKTFLENLPDIRKDVEAGGATGIIDYATGSMGVGRSGEIQRQIASGVDALVRNLTGAGKSKEEALDYAKRYMIAPQDKSDVVLSKLDGLEKELRAIEAGVMTGRGGGPSATPPPADTGGNIPAPKTDAEFNALASGTIYIDPDDGKQYRKP